MSGGGPWGDFGLKAEVFSLFGDDMGETLAMVVGVVVDGEAPSSNATGHVCIGTRGIVTKSQFRAHAYDERAVIYVRTVETMLFAPFFRECVSISDAQK